MPAIIIALASVAFMAGLWLIAWVLWRLPRSIRPLPTRPSVTASTTAVQSSVIVGGPRPKVVRDDDYAKDKAKTAFFERHKPPPRS